MTRRKRILGISFVLALLIGAGGYYWGYPLFSKQAKITATGTIEVTTADITPKVGGYLAELSIIEGDKVQSGQRVARIDRNDLALQVAQTEGALKKAMYQLTDLQKGARPQEIDQVRAKLSAAEAAYVKAQADFERASDLFADRAIAAQQFDAAKASRDIARGEVAALQNNLSLLEEGTRTDQISAQQEEVERSRTLLAISKTLLADTLITSPLTGIVVSKNYENREYVNPGAAIATILDLDDCWVKIYISSQQISALKTGQAAAVLVDAFPGKTFTGVIKEVGTRAEFTPHNMLTQNERAVQVFPVKVKIDNAEGVLKPGMPADVVIQLAADGTNHL